MYRNKDLKPPIKPCIRVAHFITISQDFQELVHDILLPFTTSSAVREPSLITLFYERRYVGRTVLTSR